jgi:hypothetical protein
MFEAADGRRFRALGIDGNDWLDISEMDRIESMMKK